MSPVGMPERTPVHVAVVGDLDLTLDSHDRPRVVESEIRNEDLQEVVGMPIAPVGDASSVGREERAAVVTRRGDEVHGDPGGEILDEDVALAGLEGGVEEMTAVRREASFS